MKIPPYWSQARCTGGQAARGQGDGVVACGWSFTSLEEAKQQAELRAKRIFERVTRGEPPGAYEYADRPIKEEIIRHVTEGDTLAALITRNRYGALVLNSANVLFADVDFPPPGASGLVEWFVLAFSARKKAEKRQAMVMQTAQFIADWAQRNPARPFRLYRTPRGMRLLFVDKLYEPTSEEALATLRDLRADPLYIKLTQKQECFRARLTAKPWRCGCPNPPNAYPWETEETKRVFRKWEAGYAEKSAKFRACEFIREFGRPADIPAIKAVVAAHDQEAGVHSVLPLA